MQRRKESKVRLKSVLFQNDFEKREGDPMQNLAN